jgi:hypothetical protein
MTTPAPAPAEPVPAPGTATATAAAAEVGESSGRSGRLANGELRALVAAYLAARPAEELTPREIARGLGGRSAGAVGNALAHLTQHGLAELTFPAPRRYRATATTTDATHTITPTTTPPPAAPASPPPASAVSATPTAGTTPSTDVTAAPGEATSPPAVTPAPTTTPPTASPAAASAPTVAAPVSSAPSGVAASSVPVTGPVPRPNGQLYHPRLLSGVADVTALRRLREAGVPALLYGPPGTGKTSVAEAAYPDLITVPGDGDTTVADLVGEYTQTPDGRYVFVDGPLVVAMTQGRCLSIDDATLIPPTVLAVVYPAMDGRREVVVKADRGRVVTAAPGFYVAAGHNPGVHGAILSDALSSRFSAQIQVSTDYDLATALKIDRRAVRAARNLATRVRNGEIGWAPQLRELIAYQRIADALGTPAAAGNLIGIAPDEDRDTVATVIRAAFGTAVVPLALGARI